MTILSPLAMAFSAFAQDIPRGVIELPEAHAEQWLALTKGAHKYVKRVPTGKTTKTGKPRYRYFYDVGHGGGVHAHEHMVEGAAFRHGDGHFHITKVDGDKLHVRHSQTGAEHVTTKRELAGKLEAEHGSALKAYRERAVKALAEAKESGASAKQIARLEERVKSASKARVVDPRFPKADTNDPRESRWIEAVESLATKAERANKRDPFGHHRGSSIVYSWAADYAAGRFPVPPIAGHRPGTKVVGDKSVPSPVPDERVTESAFNEAVKQIGKLGDPSKFETHAEMRQREQERDDAKRAKRDAIERSEREKAKEDALEKERARWRSDERPYAAKPELTIGGRKASEARVRSATREEFIASEGEKVRAQQAAAMASVESDIAAAYPGPHPHGLTPTQALFLDKNPTAESKKLSERWLSANKALKSDINAALSTAGHAWDQANRPRNKDARDDIHFKGRSVL